MKYVCGTCIWLKSEYATQQRNLKKPKKKVRKGLYSWHNWRNPVVISVCCLYIFQTLHRYSRGADWTYAVSRFIQARQWVLANSSINNVDERGGLAHRDSYIGLPEYAIPWESGQCLLYNESTSCSIIKAWERKKNCWRQYTTTMRKNYR